MNVLKGALDCSVYADEASLFGALLAHFKFGHEDTSEGPFAARPPRHKLTAPTPAVTNENVLLGLVHLSPQKCVARPSLAPACSN